MSKTAYTTIASPHIRSFALTPSLPYIPFLFHIISTLQREPQTTKKPRTTKSNIPLEAIPPLSPKTNSLAPSPLCTPPIKKMPPHPLNFNPYKGNPQFPLVPSPTISPRTKTYTMSPPTSSTTWPPSGKTSSISRVSFVVEDFSILWKLRK